MTPTRRPMLELYKGFTMDRWRLRRKDTGETAEVSAMSAMGACTMLGWKMSDCYILDLGKMPILVENKRYVRPRADDKERSDV